MLLGLERFRHGDFDSDSLLETYVVPALRSSDTAAKRIAESLLSRYCDGNARFSGESDPFDEQLDLFLKSDCENTEDGDMLAALVGFISFPVGIACAIVFGAIDGFWWGLPWLIAGLAIPAVTLPWRPNMLWPFCNPNDLAAAKGSFGLRHQPPAW